MTKHLSLYFVSPIQKLQIFVEAYLKEPPSTAAVTICEPALDWHDLQKVITESDRENWYSSNVEHRVELDKLSDYWDTCKVLVEAIFVGLAGEWWVISCVFTFVWKATESIPCKLSFNKQQKCSNDV
jgi:hypothetical protein